MATYLIKSARGEFELTVDDTDTITFGPAIPFPARQQLGQQLTYALRVYDGKKKLRAVFPGVFEIREEGIRLTPVSPEVEEIPMPRGDGDDRLHRQRRAIQTAVGLGAVPTKGEDTF